MNERDIFIAAFQKEDPAERTAYLDQVCGGDASLRRRVDVLLQAHEMPGSFLEQPAIATGETADVQPGQLENGDLSVNAPLRLVDPPGITEGPGSRIGPYKLLQQIGEGGMGVVYMAEQEHPVRRRVALKIIKPGMDSRQVVARFEAERQALAMMDHTNIAKVLDAGAIPGEPGCAGAGRLYFVMELVKGVPITKFCDDNHLSTRERLELFVPVCQAIQHAHQKGIIHRDIKPSNVMVTLYDGRPVPKVIDFGVAKATDQRLTERTMFTQYGQIVGTFEYMSPEQAEMSGLDIDTRSDVYGLGVLLYELLTGSTPLSRKRLLGAAYAELLRIIREEEPEKPSTRLSHSGEALVGIAVQRKTEPAKLSKLVRGELDWIVMRCLEKDRTRRYDTANGLARDVQRYLADEAVEACPPTAGYKLRKFARKYRTPLRVAGAFALLLVLGVVVSAWQAVRATRSEARALADRDEMAQARQDERRARLEADALRRKTQEDADRLKEAHGSLMRGRAHFEESLWSSALADYARAAELQPTLADVYSARMDLYTRLGLWELAASDSAKAFALKEPLYSALWYQHAVLRLYVGDGEGHRTACARMLKHFDKANDNLSALNLVKPVLAPVPVTDPADLVRRAEQVVNSEYVHWHLYVAGMVHYRAGQYDKAVQRLRQSLTAVPLWNARAINFPILALAYHRLGQADEASKALASAEKAIDGWTKTFAKGGVDSLPIPWFDWLECQLFYREAQIVLTGSPPPDDPRLRALHERSLAAISKGDVAVFLDRGRAHARQGAWDQAAAAYAQALDLLPDTLAHESESSPLCAEMVQRPEVFAKLVQQRPHDARLWVAHGRSLARQREWAKAAADYAKVMESRPPDYSASLEYASLLLLAGDSAGYKAFCARLAERFSETNNPGLANCLVRVCALAPQGVSDPARLLQWASALPKIKGLHALGAAHYRAGQFDEAIRCFREHLEANPDWVGQCMNDIYLALAYGSLGQTEEARKWLGKTDDWLDKANRELALEKVGFPRWTIYPADWLIVQVLRREAEALMDDNAVKVKGP